MFYCSISQIYKGGQMVNRNSKAYRLGRAVGRIILIAVGYVAGKRWGRRPIDQFPPKK